MKSPVPPRRSKQASPRKTRRYRLRATTCADEEEFIEEPRGITIPLRWLKVVIGFFLLPLCWISGKTFFDIFAHATIEQDFWATEEFWFFSLGGVLWLIAFFGLPRPIWIYVFGHELTHAIWVWFSGGRVSRIHVSSKGGYIMSDRTSVWISLAPYFFPIYSMLVIALFGACEIFWDVSPYRRLLFALVGITWAFHFTFTIWMILKEQPDLLDHGTFFSLVLIFLINLLVLTVFFTVASPEVTAWMFATHWVESAADFSHAVVQAGTVIFRQARQFF